MISLDMQAVHAQVSALAEKWFTINLNAEWIQTKAYYVHPPVCLFVIV